VALSAKYGILTPYTSFLADERVQLHTASANLDRAALSLEALSELSGEAGVNQRAVKQELMQAARAPAVGAAAGGRGAESPADSIAHRFGGEQTRTRGASGQSQGQPMAKAARGGAGFGGMGGGLGGMMGAMPQKMAGRDAESERPPAPKVRQIGTKTFYWKNNRWVDAAVTPEEDAKGTKIAQFSDRYFELARTQKAEYNQYLSQAEPVTVKLDGQVYHIEPAAKEGVQ
jgi:Ca-activated chloride channel homolog